MTIAGNVVDEANLKVSNAPTNGYFLSAQSGNTGGLTWAEVTFPPALELYAENYDGTSTKPTATGTNSVSIGRLATAAGANSFAAGNAVTATGAQSVVVGYHSSSHPTGEGAAAFGYNADAAAPYSSAIGPYSVTAGSNNFPAAIGKSYASGADSFAAAIANNTSTYGATGANSVAIGKNAKASNSYGVALGLSSFSSGWGAYSLGYNSVASGNYSTVFGFFGQALEERKVAISGGGFAARGDAQSGIFVLRSDTTNATAEALTTTNSTAATTNQIIIPNNSAYSFSGTIIAREQASAGSDYASWEIKGALLRDANAASTVLGNGIQNKMYATSGASAWAIALTADTTNGGLKIQVTGAASTNIRWVATVNTSEVTY